MNHGEQFRRSINIWKLTDYEKIDIYVEIYLWMNEMFNDLNIYNSYKYPSITFYGTSKENIILEQDLKNDWNCIHYDKVYSVFNSKYKSYISDYKDIMSIFQEYLVNDLYLKGSRTDNLMRSVNKLLVSDLHLKGSRTIISLNEYGDTLVNDLHLKGSRTYLTGLEKKWSPWE